MLLTINYQRFWSLKRQYEVKSPTAEQLIFFEPLNTFKNQATSKTSPSKMWKKWTQPNPVNKWSKETGYQFSSSPPL